MRCCCLSFFLVCLLPVHALGDELLDYLQNYEGRWSGTFSIRSTVSDYTESFPVEQRYWWKDGVLHGLSVSQRDSGMKVATSETWVDGEKVVAEIKRGEAKEVFYGVLRDGGLVWLSSDLKRAHDYQMRESFAKGEGSPEKLIIEGFDTYLYAEGIAYLMVKGELDRQMEAAGKDP